MGVSSVGRASPLYEERARGARLSLDGPITQRKNRCVEGLLPAIALPTLVHLRFSATWKGGRSSSAAVRRRGGERAAPQNTRRFAALTVLSRRRLRISRCAKSPLPSPFSLKTGQFLSPETGALPAAGREKASLSAEAGGRRWNEPVQTRLLK